jgi:hypothetical protein
VQYRTAPPVAFVETALFTSRLMRLGLEVPFQRLQLLLWQEPESGAVDPGTGGLRKVRMPDPGRGIGKRGGARVHYLWLAQRRIIYFLWVYGKHEQDALTAAQKAVLRTLARRIRAEAGET